MEATEVSNKQTNLPCQSDLICDFSLKILEYVFNRILCSTATAMVKNFEQQRNLPVRKRVSFDANSKTNENGYRPTTSLSFSEESGRNDAPCIATSFLNSNTVEGLLRVAQRLSSRKRDCIECPLEVAKRTAYSHESHRNATACSCSDGSRWSIDLYEDEKTKSHPSEETQMRHLTPVVKSSFPSTQLAVFSHDLKNECEHKLTCAESNTIQKTDTTGHGDLFLSQTLSVGNSAKDGVQFFGENESSNPATGNIITHRKNGEGLDPCRGYSSQRRHGRKASLGVVEITKLIPTLVSENEEFRHIEYRRKLPGHTLNGAQNVTL